jgi:esterase/lipase superfamily enzyme
MASTSLLKSAYNPGDDAASLPRPRRARPRPVFTSGARQHVALFLLAAVAMILAGGCVGPAILPTLMPTPNLYAHTPDNPFVEVPPPLCTSTVDVVYVTDRKPEGDPAKDPQYGSQRSKSLAFGMTTVGIGKDVSWDDLVIASRSTERQVNLPMSTVKTREVGRFPPVPTREVERDGQFVESPESVEARLVAEAQLKALVADRLALTPKKEVYIFIHGTGSNFSEPMFIMAGIWHFMGRSGVPVAYTWPAGGGSGSLQGYNYDRESSEFTVFHLKQFLRLLASCPGVEKVHILAHSRGTDTAITALRELAIEVRASGGDPRQALKIGCVVLAAADIDVEVSTQRISAERIMRVPEQMVLYVSPTDTNLNIADWLFGGKQRLGQSQKADDLTRRRTELLQHLPDIQFIVVRMAGSLSGSHTYFYSHPAVSSDLILLLRDNRRPGAENGRPLASEAGGLWRIDENYPAPTPGTLK